MILDGISVREFILQCTGASGAHYLLRYEPMDILPKAIEPSTWHTERLGKDVGEYAELRNMNQITLEEKAAEEYKKAVETNEKNKLESADKRAKYESMLAEVVAWQPPSEDFKELYDFMIMQIEESIEFDCLDYDNPIELSGQEWYKKERDRIFKSIGYHCKEQEAETKRAQKRTEWMQKLWNSLPPKCAES